MSANHAIPKSPPLALGARGWLLLIGAIALLGVTYLTQTSQAAQTGQRIQEQRALLERIRGENAQLEFEIAQLTSPAQIAERARRLGFRPATTAQTQYLIVTDVPPEPKPITASSRAQTEPRSSHLLSWIQALVARLSPR